MYYQAKLRYNYCQNSARQLFEFDREYANFLSLHVPAMNDYSFLMVTLQSTIVKIFNLTIFIPS